MEVQLPMIISSSPPATQMIFHKLDVRDLSNTKEVKILQQFWYSLVASGEENCALFAAVLDIALSANGGYVALSTLHHLVKVFEDCIGQV